MTKTIFKLVQEKYKAYYVNPEHIEEALRLFVKKIEKDFLKSYQITKGSEIFKEWQKFKEQNGIE